MAQNANTQKTPYRTIDSDANDRYVNPFDAIETGTPANDQGNVTPLPANQRVKNAVAQYQYRGTPSTAANVEPSPVPKVSKVGKKQAIKHIQSRATGQAKVTAVNVTVVSWTLYVWYLVLVPLSITAFILLGAVYSVTDSFLTSIPGFGSTETDIQNLYLWSWGGLIVASLVIHSGAWLHYKFFRIKSLRGSGATIKETTFMLSVIMSIIPGVALLPTILLWEAAVEVYPN